MSKDADMPDFVEILARGPGAAGGEAEQWFRSRGFTVQRMRAGLLLSAPRAVVLEVFPGAGGDSKLPVPAPVRAEIQSLTLMKPHGYRP